MPYYRHLVTQQVVHTKAGSSRDKELSKDAEWGRTGDVDDVPGVTSQPEPSVVAVPNPDDAV